MIPYHGRQLLTINCGWSRLRSPDMMNFPKRPVILDRGEGQIQPYYLLYM